MYPRNAASPEPIAIGPVVQISDGAVQTSGVTVRVKPIGVAEADGGGTTAYSTDGVVLYTPTQAETNYTSFVLIAKKTGCIPASVTVVTSASNTTGYAGTDHSKILNPSSTVNLSGTTIKTATDVETDTQDIQSRLPAALVNGLLAANAQVVGDKTGFKLASDGLTANNAGDPIAGIVWDALLASYTTANTFGARVVRSLNSNNTVQITGGGSYHIFAVLHDSEPGSIHEDAFDTGALSARVLASDAVGEVVDGVWDEPTSGHTTAGTTGKALIDSGAAGNPWSTDLSTGYSGTQAGNILNEVKVKTDTITTPTINVYPVSASTPERVQGTTLTFYRNESRSVSVVTDFTLTSLTLQFTVEDADGVDVYTLANGSISRSGQTFTVSVTTAVTGNLGQYRWSMRDISGGGSSVIAMGVLTVQEAASNV